MNIYTEPQLISSFTFFTVQPPLCGCLFINWSPPLSSQPNLVIWLVAVDNNEVWVR